MRSQINYSEINWAEVQEQAVEVLQQYVRIDTTNPPGGETAAAEYLASLLRAEGIEPEVFITPSGRPNLVARLNGTGDDAPLLLLHHMDVVPAIAERWSVPPFAGTVRDGCVWGRGAIDDKGLGTIHLMAFLLLKRLDVSLDRDVILLAVSDEEEGGANGAQWIVDNHWPSIRCEYVWDEGGLGSRGIIGGRDTIAVSVTEKRSTVLRLHATGAGGHGSIAERSPLDRLVTALAAIQEHEMPARFNDVTRELFWNLSYTQSKLAGWLLRHAESPLIRSFILGQVRKLPEIDSMIRDTVRATVLHAGNKANVSPENAEAQLDVRLLPDTDADSFLSTIRGLIGDDAVHAELLWQPSSPPASPISSPMMQAFRAAADRHMPEAMFTPMQTPVATDSRFFREKGASAYGLLPVVLEREELSSIHGVDERMPIEGLVNGIRFALDAITSLGR